MQWKLFDGDVADVSTADFHRDRPRARHLEEGLHRGRLHTAAAFVSVATTLGASTVSDLGCGDGGLLSLLAENPRITRAWGYDFAPANTEGWNERGVTAALLDVFGDDRDKVEHGDVTVVTEVLEHLTDPHAAVAWIGRHSRFIVASSPWDEYPGRQDVCHAWAFDHDGYRQLIEHGGYRVLQHRDVDRFQVILGAKL